MTDICELSLVGTLGGSGGYFALSPDGSSVYTIDFIASQLRIVEYAYPSLAFVGTVGAAEPTSVDTLAADTSGSVAWAAFRSPNYYIGSTGGDIYGPSADRLEVCGRLDDPDRMTVFIVGAVLCTVLNMDISTGAYTTEGSFATDSSDMKPTCTTDGATWSAFRNTGGSYVVGRWHPDTGMVEAPGIGIYPDEVEDATSLHLTHLVAVGDSVLAHLESGLSYRIGPDLSMTRVPCFDEVGGNSDFHIEGSASNGSTSLVMPDVFSREIWQIESAPVVVPAAYGWSVGWG